MKRISLLVLLLISICSSVWAKGNQTSYYVDAITGSDTNNETSEATAWQSSSKVNLRDPPREEVIIGDMKP